MAVPVMVDDLPVTVGMFMDEINLQEEVEIIQDMGGGALGHEVVAFIHDQGPIGDLLHDGEVVGSGDERLPRQVKLG
jgi:hypothetical protein